MRILSICSDDIFTKIRELIHDQDHVQLPLRFSAVDFSPVDDYDTVIFGSANAVKFAYKLLDHKLLTTASLYAVGDQTAKLIPGNVSYPKKVFGLEPVLREIAAKGSSKKILYLCSLHSPYLSGEKLSSYNFDPVACYQINKPSSSDVELAIIKIPDVIVASCEYSLMITKRFCFSREILNKIKVFLMSSSLETTARELGYKNIYATRTNKTSELITLIKEHVHAS